MATDPALRPRYDDGISHVYRCTKDLPGLGWYKEKNKVVNDSEDDELIDQDEISNFDDDGSTMWDKEPSRTERTSDRMENDVFNENGVPKAYTPNKNYYGEDRGEECAASDGAAWKGPQTGERLNLGDKQKVKNMGSFAPIDHSKKALVPAPCPNATVATSITRDNTTAATMMEAAVALVTIRDNPPPMPQSVQFSRVAHAPSTAPLPGLYSFPNHCQYRHHCNLSYQAQVPPTSHPINYWHQNHQNNYVQVGSPIPAYQTPVGGGIRNSNYNRPMKSVEGVAKSTRKNVEHGPRVVLKKKDQKKKPEVDTSAVKEPKKPITSFNLFFKHERARILLLSQEGKSYKDHPPSCLRAENIKEFLKNNPFPVDPGKRRHRKTHGMIPFTVLAKHVSQSWKCLDKVSKESFQQVAREMKQEYHRQIAAIMREENRVKNMAQKEKNVLIAH